MINWEELAQRLGTLHQGGESGSSDLAKQALELIVGESQWREAVDYYISHGPGAELARSVLWLVSPWSAMLRCRELVSTSSNQNVRRSAVELLRVVADNRVLPWVREYLHDPDEGVQTWGAGIVDQLLWSREVEPEDCADLLEEMEAHENPSVRETHAWIRSFLHERHEGGAADDDETV